MQVVSSFLDVNSVIPAYKRCKPTLMHFPECEEDTILPEPCQKILSKVILHSI